MFNRKLVAFDFLSISFNEIYPRYFPMLVVGAAEIAKSYAQVFLTLKNTSLLIRVITQFDDPWI